MTMFGPEKRSRFLSKREQLIFAHFLRAKEDTEEMLSNKYCVTRERIRQIHRYARRKLKKLTQHHPGG